MKFFKYLIIITLYFGNTVVFSKTINSTYAVEWKSIQLGELYWNIALNEDNYSINFNLKSSGLLDALYTYESKSIALGKISRGTLITDIYTSTSKNSKRSWYQNIQFINFIFQKKNIIWLFCGITQ
jgi:hypothetical protein